MEHNKFLLTKPKLINSKNNMCLLIKWIIIAAINKVVKMFQPKNSLVYILKKKFYRILKISKTKYCHSSLLVIQWITLKKIKLLLAIKIIVFTKKVTTIIKDMPDLIPTIKEKEIEAIIIINLESFQEKEQEHFSMILKKIFKLLIMSNLIPKFN